MAAIRQRAGIWQARVRRKGYPEEVQSFSTKSKAQQWARSIEGSMDAGVYTSIHSARELLFTDVLERYVLEVTPTKRGAKRESDSIRFMQRHKMARYSMATLTPAVIADYRDNRLQTVSAGTIIRELTILSGVISHARREWSLAIENPCALVRKPPTPPGRSRLLTIEEEDRLLYALQPTWRRSPWMAPMVMLALETAMRRGELLSLRWENVNLSTQTAFLPFTKSGMSRTVPLSTRAVAILQQLERSNDGRVIPITDMGMEAAFRKARERAGIANLHFHDLRHTAITRLASKLPNVIELAAVTGHQTIQMLKRYYHPSAEILAKKLG